MRCVITVLTLHSGYPGGACLHIIISFLFQLVLQQNTLRDALHNAFTTHLQHLSQRSEDAPYHVKYNSQTSANMQTYICVLFVVCISFATAQRALGFVVTWYTLDHIGTLNPTTVPSNGVLWVGDPSWLYTANNVSIAQSIQPLTWNQSLANITATTVQQAATQANQCGVDVRPSQGLSFTLTSPIWEQTANSFLLRFQSAAWNAPPSSVVNGYLGNQFPPSVIQPLAYVFASSTPISIGCVVQSCNTSFSRATCLTNITANSSSFGAAQNFALASREPLVPVGVW